MTRKSIALLLAMALASVSVQADELRMKNGSLLIGEVISSEAGNIVFKTEFAGEIKVSSESVLEVRTDNPVTLKMTNGTIYRDKLIVQTEQGTAVRNEGETPIYFRADDISYVNPAPCSLAMVTDGLARLTPRW